MATKLRLQRRGRKNHPFYQIIVADSRAPRDGKYIERIGSYNPNTNPATITLDFDRALYWLQTGRTTFRYCAKHFITRRGINEKHLLGGVAKGAFDEAEAEKRFNAWKNSKIEAAQTIKNKEEEKKTCWRKKIRLDAEKEINKAKADALAKKRAEEDAANAPVAEESAEAVDTVAPNVKEVSAPAEEPKAEKLVKEDTLKSAEESKEAEQASDNKK